MDNACDIHCIFLHFILCVVVNISYYSGEKLYLLDNVFFNCVK